ncbi:hypothetical protein UMN179_00775 [Gallibacterium anatis UMN179]|uniref:Uncharacterized protein n=1 Tax=Gallibacterium anatis (strain UMN179) TaxID=1005058 RepID=F4HE76_GALAU|nr:hypothetical protein UMN179_00775 [Gallibacterium anatis UMN179]
MIKYSQILKQQVVDFYSNTAKVFFNMLYVWNLRSYKLFKIKK